MFRKCLAILLCTLVVFGPELAASQIKRKPTEPSTQEVLQGPPSFRTIYRRGETDLGAPPAAPAQVPSLPSRMDAGSSGKGGVGETVDLMYQVHILGEVQQPGTYRIAPSERLSEVLKRAGGITESGSERYIQLRRQGQKSRVVDLFEFGTRGNLDDNPYLADNDVIFVPLVSKLIQVVGAVRRPNYYELKKEKTLADVITLAGGFNISASMEQPIRVVRYRNGDKQVDEIQPDEQAMRAFDVEMGDVIFVPDVITAKNQFDYNVASIPGSQPFYPSYDDRVFVLGGVNRPGVFTFSPHYTINQYIAMAGGVSDLGKEKYRVTSMDGKSRIAKADEYMNPGDTIVVQKRVMRPIDWVSFTMGIASFGLSTTATVLALTR